VNGVERGDITRREQKRARVGSLENTINTKTSRKVALLGSHLPRQCGIATFTSDLTDALQAEASDFDCFVVAMNDVGCRYPYRDRVRFEISEGEIASYRRAADFLNVNAVDAVCLQHEYGIFGGKAGSHVLALLRELRMPVTTTLHTILAEPNSTQRSVMEELIQLSERMVVMSRHGAELLKEVHQVPESKIDLIPHGIDTIPFEGGKKSLFGVEGQAVILTFGLLSPDKGIEYAIDALPEILSRFPETVYIVLGATHPHVKERHGETYRLMLENRAMHLGVASHVLFHNRFVSRPELREFLAAADIYVTPYLKPEQITSGTLAYALGSGKAVISTPYWYAEELLADGRGILVPWRAPKAIAKSVIELLADDSKRLALRKRAAAYGRKMAWPEVAKQYRQCFEHAIADYGDRRTSASRPRTLAGRTMELPELRLNHLRAMSDSTGLLQHADYNVPCYDEGYCLDDNARALLLTALLEDSGAEEAVELRALAARYLAFVSHAFNPATGRFRNKMSYARHWLEDCGSEDSHGRAIWALGAVVGRSSDPGRQSLGSQLFHASLPVAIEFSSPRAWAFALLGITQYLRAFRGDSSVQSMQRVLAERLVAMYRSVSVPGWNWFESSVTYSNARLPQALIAVGRYIENAEMTAIGVESLTWLAREQTSIAGHFAPIGSNGFWRQGDSKPAFDQQPLEAAGMVSACLEAARSTGDVAWLREARRAFYWFLGDNHLQQALYDDATGGCRDGLHEERVNQNQGAESTLAFLLALIELRETDWSIFDLPESKAE
jgi:glycosyltransferase involved in cell wall biosynthesis